MPPTLIKRWIVPPPLPPEIDGALAEYPSVFRQVLYNRGVHDAGEARLFLAAFPAHQRWSVQKGAIAPTLDRQMRRTVEGRGSLAQDLRDLTAGLGAGALDTAVTGPRSDADRAWVSGPDLMRQYGDSGTTT